MSDIAEVDFGKEVRRGVVTINGNEGGCRNRAETVWSNTSQVPAAG